MGEEARKAEKRGYGGQQKLSEEEKRKRLQEMMEAGQKYEDDKKKTFKRLDQLEAEKSKLEEKEREREKQRQEDGEIEGHQGFLGKVAKNAYMETDRDLAQGIKSRRGRADRNLTDRFLEKD